MNCKKMFVRHVDPQTVYGHRHQKKNHDDLIRASDLHAHDTLHTALPPPGPGIGLSGDVYSVG